MRDLCGDGDLSCGQAETYSAGDSAMMIGLRLSCAVPAAFDTLERFAAELMPNLVLSAC